MIERVEAHPVTIRNMHVHTWGMKKPWMMELKHVDA